MDIHGPGLLNQIVFAQWMIADAFLVYTTVKYGKYQWRQHPVIANNLGHILALGFFFCLDLHLSIAATFMPIIVGRRVVRYVYFRSLSFPFRKVSRVVDHVL